MSSAMVNLKNSQIPLEEIHLATQNFSSESLIRDGQNSKVYKGRLSESWPYRAVAIKCHDKYYYKTPHQLENELQMVSSLNHVNIIPFVGYYHDNGEMIIVSKYAENGSLDQKLRKHYWLSWARLLKISIGAARGLEYLHSGLGDHSRVIHRDFKTSNILLDENLEARICGFDFSILVDRNQPPVYNHASGSLLYLDPVYYEKGIVNPELDVYSFGVVLFEMFSGMLRYNGQVINYVQPQTLINLVRNYDDGLDKLLKSDVRKDMDIRSFHVFKDIAYKCISLKLKDRPTMSLIVKGLEEALAIENRRAASIISARSQPYEIRESLLIPVKEISLAIKYPSREFKLKPRYNLGKFHDTHKGQLSESWQNQTAIFKCFDHDGSSRFSCELSMFLRFKNENVIPLIGFCEHSNESFLVLEYAVKGSLYDHLNDPSKRRLLKWAERLKICIGAARGLKYLHSGLGENTRVIHRNVKSAMILLDGNLEAKLSDFCFSVLVDQDQPQDDGYHAKPDVYTDPLYSGISKTEVDVYSFGVVLFEILSGMLANKERGIGGLKILVDPNIEKEINIDSLRAFMKIANRCTSLDVKDRPTMNRVLSRIEEARDIQLYSQKLGVASTIATRSQKLESYQIALEEIILATNDFGQDTLRGAGGFGKVYEGKLPERWQNCTVAIKKLDDQSFQGDKEFQNELKLIFKFHHENIIPFVGYYDKGNMKIIITEYASKNSLDHHLQDQDRRTCLTWAQRLKICLGAAKGLNYLHSGPGKDDGVIHRDVKSANILLDKNMVAKICDFGLSKQKPNNQQGTHVHTKTAGTQFYLDPFYQEKGLLSRSSDVYSFGVVLFEILSGVMAYKPRDLGDGAQTLIKLVERYKNQLKKLIDPTVRDHIDSRCLRTFKEIA